MKYKFLTLLMIPMMLLTSCGKGQKITEDKAKELATKITANEEALDGASFEFVLSMKGSSGRNKDYTSIVDDAETMVHEEKENQDITYTLDIDKNENSKLKVKGNDGEEKFDFVIYTVKNETYEEVSYIKDYDQETKTYKEYVYGKNVTPNYSSLVTPYSMQLLAPAFMLAGLMDPVKLMESDDFKDGEVEEDGLTFSHKVAYYSNGEKNLTIESTIKCTSKEIPEDEEVSLEGKYSITYDNLVFKKATITGKSNYGNSSNIKANLAMKKVTVELPSNWESLLVK